MSAVTFEKSYAPERWSILKRCLGDWRVHWWLLLLPTALLVPALPIDETRYLAVAWETYVRQDYLVLHLNGVPYAEKGPLLFWLINLGWLFAKPSVWLVRMEMLLLCFACVWMLQRLTRRLGGSARLADNAALIFCGMAYTVVFSDAVMFDILLTTCVLVALHGVIDLDMGYRRWGIATIALGLGFGMLTKGPVALLDGAFVLLLGPLWSETARRRRVGWYSDAALGLIGAGSIALCWAIPAASRGGTSYAHAIFLGQTVGRLANSFAHARPAWWYCAVLPLMLLPWSISLRVPFKTGWHALATEPLGRFALIWFAPAFAAFCFISGKQTHYLLPLLPGIALAFAYVLEHEGARVDGRAFGGAVVLFALALVACGYLPAPEIRAAWPGWNEALDVIRQAGGTGLAWLVLLTLLGSLLVLLPTWYSSIRSTAFVSIAVGVVCVVAMTQMTAPRLHLEPAGQRVRDAQEHDQPIASIGSTQGVLTFAGRVLYPINQIDMVDVPQWCAANPAGELFSIFEKFPIEATPIFEQPMVSGRIRFWRASDLCTTFRPGGEQR